MTQDKKEESYCTERMAREYADVALGRNPRKKGWWGKFLVPLVQMCWGLLWALVVFCVYTAVTIALLAICRLIWHASGLVLNRIIANWTWLS